jgi:hypothetical protein
MTLLKKDFTTKSPSIKASLLKNLGVFVSWWYRHCFIVYRHCFIVYRHCFIV